MCASYALHAMSALHAWECIVCMESSDWTTPTRNRIIFRAARESGDESAPEALGTVFRPDAARELRFGRLPIRSSIIFRAGRESGDESDRKISERFLGPGAAPRSPPRVQANTNCGFSEHRLAVFSEPRSAEHGRTLRSYEPVFIRTLRSAFSEPRLTDARTHTDTH